MSLCCCFQLAEVLYFTGFLCSFFACLCCNTAFCLVSLQPLFSNFVIFLTPFVSLYIVIPFLSPLDLDLKKMLLC